MSSISTHHASGAAALPARPAATIWPDVIFCSLIVIAVLTVFANHVLGLHTFIGDSDRLNSYLNIRLFEYDSLKTLGRIPLWDARMFAGLPLAGLHWMNVGADPLPYILQFFERGDVFRVLGYVTALLVVLASLFAYVYMRCLVGAGLPAMAGALLYGLSVFALHRAAQVDNALLTVVLLPLGLTAILQAQRNGLAGYILLTGVLVLLCFYGFLQEVAYALIFFGCYSLYRVGAAALAGEPGWRRPAAAFAFAALVALVFAAPRLMTVAADLQQLSRTQTFHYTDVSEIARLLHEGLLGRYQGEGRALGNGTNLHEGLQLLGSTLAVLVVVAGILRPQTISQLAGGLLFLAVCGVAFSGLALPRILSSHLVAGLSGAGSTLLTNVVVLAAAATALFAARRRWDWGTDARTRALVAALVPDEPRPRDTTFHIWTLAVVLAIVLVREARYGLYLLFGRIDFTHSRVSMLAVLSLASLFAIYSGEFGRLAGRASKGTAAKGALASALFVFGAAVAWLLHGPGLDRLIGLHAFALTFFSNHIQPAVLVKVLATVVLFAALLSALALLPRSARMPSAAVVALLCGFAAGETITYGRFKLAGPHTFQQVPFEANNYLNVETDRLRPPSLDQVTQMQARLETRRFRSVIVGDAAAFPSNDSPHLTQFWDLRLLGGYSAGVPSRLAALDWPAGVVGLRSIEFTSPQQLSAALLAMLNVKYAVLLDNAFYYNDTGRTGALRVLVNPIAPLPRHYLAKRITPVAEGPTTLRATASNAPPQGLAATAVPNGGLMLSWSTTGPPDSERLEVYGRPLDGASGQRVLMARLGTSALSLLIADKQPGSTWAFELRACEPKACTDFTPPLLAQVASGNIARPTLDGAQLKPAPSGRYALDIPPRADADILVEGRASAKDRFRQLARLAPGEGYALLDFDPEASSVELRLRACRGRDCSEHSQARLFVLSDDAWRTKPSEADGRLFEQQRGSLRDAPLVEGIGSEPVIALDAGGRLDVRYFGDRIDVAVDPSEQPRFLVLNELYHPAWKAYAGGKALEIYPTNLVMRGVLLPPRTSAVTLRFEPFSASVQAHAAMLLAVGLFVLGGWPLRRRATT